MRHHIEGLKGPIEQADKPSIAAEVCPQPPMRESRCVSGCKRSFNLKGQGLSLGRWSSWGGSPTIVIQWTGPYSGHMCCSTTPPPQYLYFEMIGGILVCMGHGEEALQPALQGQVVGLKAAQAEAAACALAVGGARG